jgi:ribosomal protein S27AE
MRPAKPATKTCRMCGETFTRTRFASGRLEDYSVFLTRTHCSVTCANRARVKTAPKKAGLLQRSYKYRKTVCEACGATTNLHAHHIDSNRYNVTPENIQTLCGRCHATHHHRARRAGQAVAGRMACPE